MTKLELLRELDRLAAENASLIRRIGELENQISFVSQNKTLARGMAGERLVSNLIGGSLTLHTAKSDIVLTNGTLVEVKYATISRSSAGYEGGRRWQWQKVFGEKNAKVYDFLVLVGEADPAHCGEYVDPSSPYVIFLIPYIDVEQFTSSGTNGARGILLSTNPRNIRGRAAGLYSSFAVTSEQLALRVGAL